MIWNEFSGAIVTLLIVGEEEEEGNMFVCMYIYESREVKPMHLLLARERERDLSLKQSDISDGKPSICVTSQQLKLFTLPDSINLFLDRIAQECATMAAARHTHKYQTFVLLCNLRNSSEYIIVIFFGEGKSFFHIVLYMLRCISAFSYSISHNSTSTRHFQTHVILFAHQKPQMLNINNICQKTALVKIEFMEKIYIFCSH